MGYCDAGAEWEALVPPLRAGEYPPERQAQVAMANWLAWSIRFTSGE